MGAETLKQEGNAVLRLVVYYWHFVGIILGGCAAGSTGTAGVMQLLFLSATVAGKLPDGIWGRGVEESIGREVSREWNDLATLNLFPEYSKK